MKRYRNPRQPYRSDRHLDFVRTLKCSVPGCRKKGEACHVGPHAARQKAPDSKAAPLCRLHHDELGHIGRVRFDCKYNICLMAIADRLAIRPFIYVDRETRRFIGRVEGEEYVLGPAKIGVKRAVHLIVELRKERLREVA